jgi:hypothetical protein
MTEHPVARACCPHAAELALPTGSRRRRLWELAAHAHCPVVGVCLPMPVLRRLVDKVLGGEVQGDDYQVHAGAIAECHHRSAVAEAIQRELDRRYAIALRQAARCKSAEALADWWRDALAGDEVAGALWATLSHARCDAVLEEQVLHDVHMLQHQLGSANRADLQRLRELQAQCDALTLELDASRQRAAQQAAQQARRIEQLQAEALRARADLIGRDTTIASLGERLAALEAAAPGLKNRFELARECDSQAERIQAQERALTRLRHELDQERRRADAAEAAAMARPTALLAEPVASHASHASHASLAANESVPLLVDRAVLCVGGRAASVPAYRRLIERTGGRFLHHDGGEHHNPAALDVTLAAADLVICQTGCISHDAYWRVKDHCKRTGKRCVFVENPSRSGLQRALLSLAPAATEPARTE